MISRPAIGPQEKSWVEVVVSISIFILEGIFPQIIYHGNLDMIGLKKTYCTILTNMKKLAHTMVSVFTLKKIYNSINYK